MSIFIERLSPEDYLDLRRKNRDKFDFYRQGKAWSRNVRRAAEYGGPILNIFPKRRLPGQMPGEIPANPPRQRQRRLLLNRGDLGRFEDFSAQDILNLHDKDRQKYYDIKATTDNLKLGFGISKTYRFKHSLGAGGFGITALFDQYSQEGFLEGEVVGKSSLVEGGALIYEKNSTRAFRKAQHLVQLAEYKDEELVLLNQKSAYLTAVNIENSKTYDERSWEEQKIVSAKPRPLEMMLMEFMPNGDLALLIKRVNAERERVLAGNPGVNPRHAYIPNSILWKFLLCLVRMCIGMAHPPAFHTANQLKNYPIMETIPADQKTWPYRIVHFDLDPKNIFVGRAQAGDAEHSINPVLKLGDFGLTTLVENDQPDQYYEQMRGFGKQGYLAPEQFTEEWEFVPTDSGNICNHDVAGNYGVHTNIWAVGLTMECLVTGCHPAWPPVRRWATDANGDAYQTYGLHVTEDARYNTIDEDLRRLITQCQAFLPGERPTLEALEAAALDGVNDVYAGETDAVIIDWFNKFLPAQPLQPVRIESARRTVTISDNYDDDDGDGGATVVPRGRSGAPTPSTGIDARGGPASPQDIALAQPVNNGVLPMAVDRTGRASWATVAVAGGMRQTRTPPDDVSMVSNFPARNPPGGSQRAP